MKRRRGKKFNYFPIIAIVFLVVAVVGFFAFKLTGFVTVTGSTCTDSDGGMNYNTKGTVSISGKTYTDYCASSSKLVEYSCYKSLYYYNLRTASYFCQTGKTCSDGACSAPIAQPIPDSNVAVSTTAPISVKGSYFNNGIYDNWVSVISLKKIIGTSATLNILNYNKNQNTQITLPDSTGSTQKTTNGLTMRLVGTTSTSFAKLKLSYNCPSLAPTIKTLANQLIASGKTVVDSSLTKLAVGQYLVLPNNAVIQFASTSMVDVYAATNLTAVQVSLTKDISSATSTTPNPSQVVTVNGITYTVTLVSVSSTGSFIQVIANGKTAGASIRVSEGFTFFSGTSDSISIEVISANSAGNLITSNLIVGAKPLFSYPIPNLVDAKSGNPIPLSSYRGLCGTKIGIADCLSPSSAEFSLGDGISYALTLDSQNNLAFVPNKGGDSYICDIN